MPVKLERALKRQATAKGLKGEHKDAYVYGTLRKTGWKPSREKKMNATQDRIVQLSKRLDNLIEFAIDINPANKGKFTATEKKTGESAEELLHSKNPLTRKRANFAIQAKKWHHMRSKLNEIQFGGNPTDPTAGMFGGNDPGLLGKDLAENEPVSALQRLRLKIASLRGMGLHG